LFRGDSTLLDGQNPVKALLRKIVLTRVFKKIDIALYVGKENKKYFLKHGLKEQQLFFIPHAIDNERFSVESNNKDAADQLRQEIGLSGNAFVFLFAGKFELKKNPEILMKAAQHTNNDVHFVFVGNGELELFLKKTYGHIVNIHFLDFQNQKMMPAVYAMADVFILPSNGPGETWGLAVNEAMACNKPVIVSNKCGCAIDLVKDGSNGYIFDAGNINDLKNVLVNFYSDKNHVASMGNASGTIIKEFSFEKIVKGIEAIMLKIKN
jgi:glycosyltransferase involved in cell wall biosynthesis